MGLEKIVTATSILAVNIPPQLFLLAVILASIIYILSREYSSLHQLTGKNGNRIPNGPVGLPIVGSFPFLTHHPEVTLDRWAKRYGALYSFWLGDQLCVVISDPYVAKDLMVTNGAIFSSRKEMFLKFHLIFTGRGITDTPHNDQWRKQRRLAAYWLSKPAVEGYTDALGYETTDLIRDLYVHGRAGSDPINPRPYVGRCSLNTILTIVFGIRADTVDHPLVERALYLSREFMNCTGPVSNLTDFFPLLQRLPNYMVTRGKKLHSDLLETYGGMIKEIDARLRREEDVPDCLAKTLLQKQEEEKLDFVDMAMICSAFMIGGVETTASIMQWFSALIPAYPHIQQMAHEELDRVVGRNRFPTMDDEKDLPYIRAIIKEVERRHNPFWLGTPHVNTENFTYHGQFIPKDTVVILNCYTMHHDPQRHPDPFSFQPERYLNDSTLSSESAKLANPMERDHWMFGVGRRMCPGILLAEREVFLAISRMLWAFKMEEIPGEQINLKKYDGHAGRSPIPFRIKVIPRDGNVSKVLDQSLLSS